jgi:Flp pilus assembly protein TadG
MPGKIPLSKKTTTAMWQSIRTFMVGPDGIAGAALIELAVLMPILLGMGIYTMDFGLYDFRRMQVQNAAQAGAQYVIANLQKIDNDITSSGLLSSSDISSINSAVTTATTFAVSASAYSFCGCPSNSGVTSLCGSPSTPSTCNACSGNTCSANRGTYVTVSAQANYTPLVPYQFFSNPSYPLNGSATVRLQ